MNVLFVGDVVADSGRKILFKKLPELKKGQTLISEATIPPAETEYFPHRQMKFSKAALI